MVEGRGGPPDIETGAEWLEKAAAGGDIIARRMLLLVEALSAKSIFRTFYLVMKVVALALRGRSEISKDPSSDKVR